MLRMTMQPVFRLSSLGSLDSGSGRQIPVKFHGTGVWHGVLSQNPSTKNKGFPGLRRRRFGKLDRIGGAKTNCVSL